MVAMSTQMQIICSDDGEIPEKIPGDLKKGMLSESQPKEGGH